MSIMSAASQIVPRVRQVEALVAEREVGDLAVAERHREAEPVVERRVLHLVVLEAAAGVGGDDVGDLAAPALDEGHDEPVRLEGPEGLAEGALGEVLELARD